MFTGLIETQGRVVALEPHASDASARRLTLDVGDWRGRGGALTPGDSIAVAGVCLTLTAVAGSQVSFDVVAETLDRSTLGGLTTGRLVNLESSLTAATLLGGHFVQGHVDGVGRVTSVAGPDEPPAITVTPPPELIDLLPPKGSVAIEGVSLTVAAVTDETFDVALIPTTLEQTTLGQLAVGDRVNLETDIIARTVIHHLRRHAPGRGPGSSSGSERPIDWQTLRDAGFLG